MRVPRADLRTKLTDNGLQYKVDESGASIGKRYARADELGIPYAVTLDFDTLGMGETGADRARRASRPSKRRTPHCAARAAVLLF